MKQQSRPSVMRVTSNGETALLISNPHLEIIRDTLGVVAILVHQPLTSAQTRNALALLRERCGDDAELARRWNVPAVYCDPDWAHEQKKRSPMLKPHGFHLAFCEGVAS